MNGRCTCSPHTHHHHHQLSHVYLFTFVLSHTPLLPSLLLPPLLADLKSSTPLPRTHDQPGNIQNTLPMLHLRKHSRAPLPHLPRIPFHHTQIRAHRPSKIALIHDQQITARNPWPPLPGHLIPPRHINHIHNKIRQLPRVVRRQIIAPRFNEQQIAPSELGVQLLQRRQVRRDILPHSGVRASSRLNGADARGGEGRVPVQKFCVFACEDVVGDGGYVVGFAEVEEEGEKKGGFAGADGAAEKERGCQLFVSEEYGGCKGRFTHQFLS